MNIETQDEGTVAVNNTCQAEGQAINIVGTAAPANPTYGAAGVFQVGFPGQPGPDCPGPNYIVQGIKMLQCKFAESGADLDIDYTGDFAIVQSNNFTTLFVLSREREVEDSVLDVSFFAVSLWFLVLTVVTLAGLDRESRTVGLEP